MQWERKGELAGRRTKRPEPSARYHISCHSHTLQSVMSSSVGRKFGFLPGEQQGEDHRSACSQWRSLSRSILCWGKISLRNGNCHGRLWSFRKLTTKPLKAVTWVLLRFSSSVKMDWKWPSTGSRCRFKFVPKCWEFTWSASFFMGSFLFHSKQKIQSEPFPPVLSGSVWIQACFWWYFTECAHQQTLLLNKSHTLRLSFLKCFPSCFLSLEPLFS